MRMTADATVIASHLVAPVRAQQVPTKRRQPSAPEPALKSPNQKVEPSSQQKKLQETVEQDDVVRITTNVVQIDAIVTKDGKQVTDLKAEDFEIFEDKKPQKITNFSYVSNVSPLDEIIVANTKDPKAGPEAPVTLREGDRHG